MDIQTPSIPSPGETPERTPEVENTFLSVSQQKGMCSPAI